MGLQLKVALEYRFWFFMNFFVFTFSQIITYIGIWILLEKFHSIADWSFYEVAFLYSINLFAVAVSLTFLVGSARLLPNMIREGTFDGMLIRPIRPFILFFFRQLSHSHLGNIALSIIVFGICFRNLPIDWSVGKVLWFGVVLCGAVLIMSSIMMITGTISFWVVNSAVPGIVVWSLSGFINYPLSIYQKWIRIILTFVVPYGFINFYPAQYFLGSKEGNLFHPAFSYGTPIVGVVFFIAALIVWKFGLKHYNSTGS